MNRRTLERGQCSDSLRRHLNSWNRVKMALGAYMWGHRNERACPSAANDNARRKVDADWRRPRAMPFDAFTHDGVPRFWRPHHWGQISCPSSTPLSCFLFFFLAAHLIYRDAPATTHVQYIISPTLTNHACNPVMRDIGR